MGWWFGRILSFEIDGDEETPTLGAVLTDSSRGAISCADAHLLEGFAAYGGSVRAAIAPLVECFGVELFDDGVALRQPTTDAATVIGTEELGNSSDGQMAARIQRDQLPARSIATALRLTYYDRERDFQTGEARAVVSERLGNEAQQEVPAVFTAAAAKSLAQQILARRWAGRDKLTLRLPPYRLAVGPGTRLQLPLSPSQWIVEKTTVEGFVLLAELRPSASVSAAVPGDGGRIVPNSDVVAASLAMALIDIPNVLGLSNEPTMLLAASASTGGWKSRAVTISFAGQELSARTASSKSVLGAALTSLAAADADLIDAQNNVEIQLIDADQWLVSCDDDGLASGENFAVLGGELFQFGEVTPLGDGKFRLARLLRGRGATEWACGLHAAGETFCLLRAGTLQPLVLPNWSLGATVNATSIGVPATSIRFLGEALRPPSPVKLMAERQGNGDLVIRWTRRSRQGFAWVDGIDAPLGETREQYRVTIAGSSGSLELDAEQPLATVAAGTIDGLGMGPATIDVRQIGDLAASRPAIFAITLS